jgi:hypothetical protein
MGPYNFGALCDRTGRTPVGPGLVLDLSQKPHVLFGGVSEKKTRRKIHYKIYIKQVIK